MRVIPPLIETGVSITEAMLAQSSVNETEPLYSSATTYALGNIVRGPVASPNAHKLFESLQPNNTNHPVTDPAWWLEIGPTNKWAMFDLLRNTASVGTSPMTVEFVPGRRIDAIGLAGVIADFVRVEVIVNGNVVFTHTEAMSTRRVTNWYQYFFADFTYKSSFALFDLPPYTNGRVRITAFTTDNRLVEIGGIVANAAVYLGDVEPTAEDDAFNFSTIDRDIEGNAELKRRRTLPKTNQTLYVDSSQVPSIRDARRKLNAVPAIWAGLEDPDHDYFPSLLILGIYTRFTINLDHETLARVALELEEI